MFSNQSFLYLLALILCLTLAKSSNFHWIIKNCILNSRLVMNISGPWRRVWTKHKLKKWTHKQREKSNWEQKGSGVVKLPRFPVADWFQRFGRPAGGCTNRVRKCWENHKSKTNPNRQWRTRVQKISPQVQPSNVQERPLSFWPKKFKELFSSTSSKELPSLFFDSCPYFQCHK
jgi:hypothetical protein